MRTSQLALASLLVLIAPSLGARALEAQSIRFAGIPWGAARAEIADSLKSAGLKLQDKDEDGDYPITGRLSGFRVRGFALMAPAGGVQKIMLEIVTPDDKAQVHYRELKKTLADKYGAPDDDIARFDKPFAAGDGRELDAIKTGKAAIASYWDCTKQEACLALEISEELTVGLSYEGPGWDKESDRRRKPNSRIF